MLWIFVACIEKMVFMNSKEMTSHSLLCLAPANSASRNKGRIQECFLTCWALGGDHLTITDDIAIFFFEILSIF